MGAPRLSIWPFCGRSTIENPSIPQLMDLSRICATNRMSNETFLIFVQHCRKTHCKTALNSRRVVRCIRQFFHHLRSWTTKFKCSGMLCSRETTHSVGQCTGSNWLWQGQITLRTLIPVAAAVKNSLSTNVLPILAWVARARSLFSTALRLNVGVLVSGWLTGIPVSNWAKN